MSYFVYAIRIFMIVFSVGLLSTLALGWMWGFVRMMTESSEDQNIQGESDE